MGQKKRWCVFWVFVITSSLAFLVFAIWFRYYRSDIVVYELRWKNEKNEGGAVFERWRYFIDTKTILPVRLERYIAVNRTGPYILYSTQILEYPTDNRMQQVIEQTKADLLN